MRGGRVHTILDNLIAQKKARPMIVAMPDGRGVTPFDRKGKTVDRTKNFDEFEASMLRDVVPFVEKNYRASQRREDRAVAGFSVGAALACRIGLRHLDRFAWVGLLSGGTRLADGFEATLKPLLGQAGEDQRAAWPAVGQWPAQGLSQERRPSVFRKAQPSRHPLRVAPRPLRPQLPHLPPHPARRFSAAIVLGTEPVMPFHRF